MASKESERRAILNGLIIQGCTYRDGSGGKMFIYFPDGVTMTTFHSSISDSRGIKNLRAIVKRAGLDWPLDSKPSRKDPRND